MKNGLFLALISFFATLELSSQDFPTPFNTEESDPNGEPPPARDSAAMFELPEGFEVSVFASEPDVQNPIAMTWDSRGRMWVAENYTYGKRGVRLQMGLRDRVLIFEDSDWDGTFDKRSVFTDQVQVLTSVEVGRGGVWLMCPPQLLFIPDKNQDDRPDAPPQVILDGFTIAQSNYHNFANGLRWGPDGWLYGRCGHSCPGLIGKPGTSKENRIPIKGGIWRYHPETEVFEVLTHGTVNPWGFDWDKHGHLFHINTVIGHLWHVIPGAYFKESSGIAPNPYVYSRIDQHADHYHYDRGKKWTASRNGAAIDFGGGHSHIGMTIYQGKHLPDYWHDKLLTWNQHGRRLNVEKLERNGSGFVGKHEPDQFIAGDDWFRGLEISTGPDGALYTLDWSDTGECHDHTGVHRTSGRIYRFSYGKPPKPNFNLLAPKDEDDLIELLQHPNPWFFRQWLLTQQGTLTDPTGYGRVLQNLLDDKSLPSATRLRAMWALAIRREPGFKTNAYFSDDDEHIKYHAVQLHLQHHPIDTIRSRVRQTKSISASANLEVLSTDQESALVRLACASGLQRLPIENRIQTAINLAGYTEDLDDHNLEHMVWFGVIPLVEKDPKSLVKLAEATQWPNLLEWISRAISSDPDSLVALLDLASADSSKAENLLKGTAQAFKGFQKVTPPSNWNEVSDQLSKYSSHKELAILFGDGKAMEDLIKVVNSSSESLANRTVALNTLIQSHPPQLKEICKNLLRDRYLAPFAVKGLSQFNDPKLGETMVSSYRDRYPEPQRGPFIDVLSTRPDWSEALLTGIEKGKIPRNHVTPFHVRQIHAFGDKELSLKLTQVWGELRNSSDEMRQQITDWKRKLTPDYLEDADLANGRKVYSTACGACHRLYGEGGNLGPDLTGSGRSNIDYLLENIVNPGAMVSAEYRMNILTKKDGQVLSGMIVEETPKTLTLRQLSDSITLQKDAVEKRTTSEQSIMPAGLLEALTPQQVKDLIAYLKHPTQVEVSSK